MADVRICAAADRWSNQICSLPAKHDGPHEAAGIPVDPVSPEKQIEHVGAALAERTEEWTCDGERFVAVDVDDHECVTVAYPILRKMLMDLGFTQVLWGES